MEGQEAALTAQSFAYEIKGDSAVILRCFSRDGRVEIPKQIGGYSVVGLGAYAFSAHFDDWKLTEELRSGKVKLCVPYAAEKGQGQMKLVSGTETDGVSCEAGTTMPTALCGERLEEITLPRTLLKVGRYCFYNCGNLRRVEFHGKLEDWGSGAFTGCHRVRSLRVYADPNGRSHLKDVLDELREEVEVEYFTETASENRAVDRVSDDWDGQSYGGALGFARLIFPEFYEEGVENTPARILENHVHGSGILYRNCFQGRSVDFVQYDALFPHAKAWESRELVLRMALDRLRFPQGLTQRAKEQYGGYLAEHAAEAGEWLLRQEDLEGVRFLLELSEGLESDRRHTGADEAGDDAGGLSLPSLGQSEFRKALTEELLGEASRLQYMEAVSFLMEYMRARRTLHSMRRHRLEL